MSEKQPAPVVAFLKAIDEVCLKHGMSLMSKNTRWTQPAFEVHHYSRTARNELFKADVCMLDDPMPNQLEDTREGVVWEDCVTASDKVAYYKDYSLRVAPSHLGGYDGFINGRLYRGGAEFSDAAKVILDIVNQPPLAR